MKMIDIVETLVSEGHKVTYRNRTDGGLIITSIDGKKFSSLTEGNKTARSMVVGGELSFARAEQVAYNVKKYIKLDTPDNLQKKKAKGSIDQELNKQLRKVQRDWRKYDIQAGRVTKKRLRYYVRTEGVQRGFEYLQGRQRYAEGYANYKNITYVKDYIARLYVADIKKKYTRIIEALIEDIENMKETFKEEWVYPIYQIVYKNEISIPEKIRQIRDLIGKPDELKLDEIGIK